MKNISFPALLLVLAAQSGLAQEGKSPLFQSHNIPDSVVQITMILPGADQPRTLTVEVTDGWAKIEGDIVLGRIEDLQNAASDRGIVRDGSSYRWPDAIIPYEIDPSFTPAYQTLLLTAIDYINGSTHLLLKPRTSEGDYIRMVPDDACASLVGRDGGSQKIWLMDPFVPANNGIGCWFSQIVHEIGHAAGLWHEQSREDRDTYVTINWDNIISDEKHNFEQEISDGIDIGPYDFSSVMHYGPFAFSKNGLPTITANGGQSFGNAPEYSSGDVMAINWMYQSNACAGDINLSLQIPTVVRPLFYEAGGTIVSTTAVASGNSVMYDAVSLVVLSPGFIFTANATSNFRAVIDGCGGVYFLPTSPEEEEWLLDANDKYGSPQQSALPGPAAGPEKSAHSLEIAPNPFSGSTRVTYTLTEPGRVGIRVFRATGELVATLVPEELQEAGEYGYVFEAEDLSVGVYFIDIQMDGVRTTKRVVLAQD